MRKLFILVLMSVSASLMSAQPKHCEAPPSKDKGVTTNSFWDNWFVQGGIQWSAFYADEEFGAGLKKNPFKSFRSNPQVSVAVGKWFTPGIGMRTKVSGIWGKTVTDSDNKGNGIKFWNAQEQVMFNLSNMISGYNPHRIYSFIPFAGAGVARNCSDNVYALGLSAGVLNQIRLGNRLALNVELGWNMMEGKFDGAKATKGNSTYKNYDNNLYAEVGVTFNIGKTKWKKSPDMKAVRALHQSELDALNARIGEKESENRRLADELAAARSKKNTEEECHVITRVSSPKLSVFFGIGSYEITDDENMVNLKSAASLFIKNDSRVMVRGYADSSTGSEEFNKDLSHKRASAVAEKLVELGVKRENINIISSGGVDTLSPESHNRRATIEIADWC